MTAGWEDWVVADSDTSHPVDLNAWLCGIPLLHDPAAVVGHRFRSRYHNVVVPLDHIAVNEFRTARKHLSDPHGVEWLEQARVACVGGCRGERLAPRQ